MMKPRICIVLAVALLLTLCACTKTTDKGGDETTSTTHTVATTVATQTTATDTTAADTTATVPQASSLTVRYTLASSITFELTLPSSWEGAYAVREADTSVIFYELQNHHYNAQGRLFTIRSIEAGAYDEGMFPEYTYLGEYDGYCIVALFPTDVQYTAEYAAEYQTLFADCNAVIESFRRVS